MKRLMTATLAVAISFVSGSAAAFEHTKPILESWDWVSKQKQVGRKFTGTPGVTLVLGDSNSYANQATRWVRQGKGHSPKEKAVLQWSHNGKRDNTDGWWLTSVDVPSGRSHTSASGVRADEYIRGGKGGMPPLKDIIKKYNPQVVYIALGTNDASAGQKPDQYIKNVETMVDALYANGTMVILVTVPTHPQKQSLVRQYNEKIYQLGAKKKFAVADVYGAFVERRPGDTWNGTLNRKNNVHFTHALSAGPPTDDNLKNCGYLLRCVVMVRKLVELKKYVVDGVAHPRLPGKSAASGKAGPKPPGGSAAEQTEAQKAMDRAVADLRGAIRKKAAGGKKAYVYVTLKGRRRRVRVTGADEAGLKVVLAGKRDATAVAWDKISAAELAGVARAMKATGAARAQFAAGLIGFAGRRKRQGRREMAAAVRRDDSLKAAMDSALKAYR